MTLYTLSRVVATFCGAAILAAASHAVVEASHQDLAHATLTYVLAAGIFAASIAIGAAWHRGRRVLATYLVAALFAAEAFNVVATGDRVVAERDMRQAEVKSAMDRYTAAQSEHTKTLEAKTQVDNTVLVEASKPGCKDRCKQLLDGQVAVANANLERARETARLNPKPTISGSPLADRLGLPAWTIDILVALLLSLGANGLAAALIAYGCHVPPAPVIVAANSNAPAEMPDVPALPTPDLSDLVEAEGPDSGLERLAQIIRHNSGSITVTNRELADLLGTSFATASRWRRAWEGQGRIAVTESDGRYVIALGGLRRVA